MDTKIARWSLRPRNHTEGYDNSRLTAIFSTIRNLILVLCSHRVIACEKSAPRISPGNPTARLQQGRLRLRAAMESRHNSIIRKLLLSYQIPRRIKKNAYTKSCLRPIDRDARVNFGLTWPSLPKLLTMSNPIFSPVNSQLMGNRAETMRYEATHCMGIFGKRKQSS